MNIIVFGAHPDDCEIKAGGTAAKFVGEGHNVKFVSLTNGDHGHMSMQPGQIARRRLTEAKASSSVLGVTSEVLDIHDCHLIPDIANRERLVGIIREWKADLVISHRPYDYHPDHRNAGILLQDTAYLVMVPLFCKSVAPLRTNPIYMYLQDSFTYPEPFRPDVIVPIDDVYKKKIESLHQMASQLYEWLPWIGNVLDKVPGSDDQDRRRNFLEDFIRPLEIDMKEELIRRYGKACAAGIKKTEAFQLCEYGRQVSRQELHILFPQMPTRIDL